LVERVDIALSLLLLVVMAFFRIGMALFDPRSRSLTHFPPSIPR
jgi:hypothetical protein